MIIHRDYTRTEHDDWKLHVQPRIGAYAGTDRGSYMCALELRDADGKLVGWQIKPMFE